MLGYIGVHHGIYIYIYVCVCVILFLPVCGLAASAPRPVQSPTAVLPSSSSSSPAVLRGKSVHPNPGEAGAGEAGEAGAPSKVVPADQDIADLMRDLRQQW